jgi:hypothetical protein
VRKSETAAVKPGVVVGVVGAVDAKANRISVSVRTDVHYLDGNVKTRPGKNIGLENLPVSKGVKLTIAGKEGKLSDIAVGTQVFMELEVRNGVVMVTGVEVKTPVGGGGR